MYAGKEGSELTDWVSAGQDEDRRALATEFQGECDTCSVGR
jgi:hypothetical protein